MIALSGSELLLYGGIALMGVALLFGVLCMVVFRYSGQKLKKKLEQEYGKLQR